MQTFLPYPDFQKSAEVLDKRRCFNQVNEAGQIINCLLGNSNAWKNHPAVKMWVGYELLLQHYYNIFLGYCLDVHKINTQKKFYPYQDFDSIPKPFWLGKEIFHRAMRSRLIEKNPEFYKDKFPGDSGFNEGKYWWPVMENKTFRII